MKYAPATLLLMACALTLVGGCGLFGKGSDDSRLSIENKGCQVDISQHGRVSGMEGTKFSEDIVIEPDCTVKIIVKDSVHMENFLSGSVDEEEQTQSQTPEETPEETTTTETEEELE